jgi:hypothetical protein
MTQLLDLMHGVELAEPDVAGALAVFPIFGPAPSLEYVSFAEGAARGVTVTELPGGASVNDLLVVNPLDVAVLLFEGEELRGAQQDRTLDGAVLVPGGIKVSVPVSCVEQGRWDGRRHSEPFAPSPTAAFPALRAAKSARMREAMAAAAPARADQGEVWEMVGPDAMAESFTGDVDALAGGIARRDAQIGAVAAIGDRFLVLDLVSRPDAWAALHGPLTRGYALDASRGSSGATPSTSAAREWLDRQAAARIELAPAVGLGERVRTGSGTGLVVDGELVQLSVYAAA